jgi:nucleoside-diphosphate-sugar epimerase
MIPKTTDPLHLVVTGGAGFIGGHLSRALLARDHKVTVVDNFDPFYARSVKLEGIRDLLDHPSFTLLETDINETDRLVAALHETQVDVIIHLAAKAGVRPSIEDPGAYQVGNVLGTQSMLEVARVLGVRAFLFGSSSSVYGNDAPIPFSESDPCVRPISPYAATKRAGELMAHTYHHLYGLPVHCLRFFTVYGPGQRPDLAIHKFARLMTTGQPIPMYGDGSSSRDYTFVSDIVEGILGSLDRLLSVPPEYEIFNLGGSAPVSLRTLIHLLGSALNVEPQVHQLPTQPGDVDRTYADITRAQTLLGYDPATTLENGLAAFADWHRRQAASVSA